MKKAEIILRDELLKALEQDYNNVDLAFSIDIIDS